MKFVSDKECSKIRKRSIVKIVICSLLIGCAVIFSSIFISMLLHRSASLILPAVFGFAHGPSSVFIAFNAATQSLVFGLIVQLLILAFALWQVIRTSLSFKNDI